MFSRKKKDKKVKASVAPKLTTDTGKSRGSSQRLAPSIISQDLVISGNLVSGGEVHIEGNIEGDIRASSLVVGDNATVSGEVVAEEVYIKGRIIGRVRGLRVILASTCHVEGDVFHESLSVEPGAFLEGSCRRSEDPISRTDSNSASASYEMGNNYNVSDTNAVEETPTKLERKPSKSSSNDVKKPVMIKDGTVVVRRNISN